MRITRGREEDKSLAKHPWKVLGGISGLGLILMLAAFPLPAFMQNRSIEEEIDGFLLQQKRLPALTEEVARLKVSVPRESEEIAALMKRMLPEVNSLLNLRNLLLAQAKATGVCVDQLDFTEAVPLEGEDLHNRSVLGRIDAQLNGVTTMSDLMLFLGFLEATGLVYRTVGLEIDSARIEDKQVSFSMDLNIFFHADAGMFHVEPVEEEKTNSP